MEQVTALQGCDCNNSIRVYVAYRRKIGRILFRSMLHESVEAQIAPSVVTIFLVGLIIDRSKYGELYGNRA
jgi:hypothetical protein